MPEINVSNGSCGQNDILCKDFNSTVVIVIMYARAGVVASEEAG